MLDSDNLACIQEEQQYRAVVQTCTHARVTLAQLGARIIDEEETYIVVFLAIYFACSFIFFILSKL